MGAPRRVSGVVGWTVCDEVDFGGGVLGRVLRGYRGRTARPYEERTACSLASMTKGKACTANGSVCENYLFINL